MAEAHQTICGRERGHDKTPPPYLISYLVVDAAPIPPVRCYIGTLILDAEDSNARHLRVGQEPDVASFSHAESASVYLLVYGFVWLALGG